MALAYRAGRKRRLQTAMVSLPAEVAALGLYDRKDFGYRGVTIVALMRDGIFMIDSRDGRRVESHPAMAVAIHAAAGLHLNHRPNAVLWLKRELGLAQ